MFPIFLLIRPVWTCVHVIMLPYQAVAMDYAVSSSFQRQTPIGLGVGVNINPAFTHSWFVPAELCVSYKQTPLLEPGHVNLLYLLTYIVFFNNTSMHPKSFTNVIAEILLWPAIITATTNPNCYIVSLFITFKCDSFHPNTMPDLNKLCVSQT